MSRLGGRHGDSGEREGPRSPPPASRIEGVSVTLTGAQISHLLREVTGSSGSRGLLLEQLDDLRTAVDAALANPELGQQKVSISALRMLGFLCAYAPAGTPKGVLEVAQERRLSPSTTHRYVRTLTEVGLLEQIPGSRKYRIPPPAEERSAPDDDGATEA